MTQTPVQLMQAARGLFQCLYKQAASARMEKFLSGSLSAVFALWMLLGHFQMETLVGNPQLLLSSSYAQILKSNSILLPYRMWIHDFRINASWSSSCRLTFQISDLSTPTINDCILSLEYNFANENSTLPMCLDISPLAFDYTCGSKAQFIGPEEKHKQFIDIVYTQQSMDGDYMSM
ncbi:hypothetical protein STEG23_033115 [Scotinomys teguina]